MLRPIYKKKLPCIDAATTIINFARSFKCQEITTSNIFANIHRIQFKYIKIFTSVTEQHYFI